MPGHRARVQEQQPVYKTKVDYGKVPAYLSDVKAEIERENDMIESYIKAQEPQDEEAGDVGEVMTAEERDALVDQLKTKWDAVNAKYQKMTHNVNLDTVGKVKRKESMEKELKQLEADIGKLEKPSPIYIKNE